MGEFVLERSIGKITEFLPPRLAQPLSGICWEHVEEIRIRVGQQIEVRGGNNRYFIPCKGEASVSPTDCEDLLERICFHSVYACEEQLKSGFITLPGGFRVGIAGQAKIEDGKIRRIDPATFFCIRIARECIGCAESVMPFLIDKDGRPFSSLIISPPGCGKTTLLRDIIRQYSYGMAGITARCVCVIDERSEIVGSWNGIPQNDLGPRCDVLDQCPKDQGILFALRSLSPEIIACDELGNELDCASVSAALSSGCAIYTTLHGDNYEAFRSKFPKSKGVFSRYLILSRQNGPGTLEAILDREGNLLTGDLCKRQLQ